MDPSLRSLGYQVIHLIPLVLILRGDTSDSSPRLVQPEMRAASVVINIVEGLAVLFVEAEFRFTCSLNNVIATRRNRIAPGFSPRFYWNGHRLVSVEIGNRQEPGRFVVFTNDEKPEWICVLTGLSKAYWYG